jgi:hypothetical protein
MTVWFCVKTADNPDAVADVVCAFNIFEDNHPHGKYTWIIQKGEGPEEYWQILGKYEQIKELSNVALVYREGDTVVFGEVSDDLVPNFMAPLLAKYGFDNLKWLVTAPKPRIL